MPYRFLVLVLSFHVLLKPQYVPFILAADNLSAARLKRTDCCRLTARKDTLYSKFKH